MPELPEVEMMCRGIAAAVNCRIEQIERPRSRLQSIVIAPELPRFRRAAVGKSILGVRRLGKKVVLELDTGDCIVIEPRMTGLVMLGDPPDHEHLRLIFRLGGGQATQILFWDQRGLGVVRLLSREQFVHHYGPARLGPDALIVSPHALCTRLGQSRRAIKVALLDQQVLAGIGNLYASEILHLARIDPAAACNTLQDADWSRLHAAMRKVLRAAIRHQGSTLRDGTYRIARDKDGDYQLHHRVYQRAGETCRQCAAAQIVRIVQAQRSTFYCPECQRPCTSGRRR